MSEIKWNRPKRVQDGVFVYTPKVAKKEMTSWKVCPMGQYRGVAYTDIPQDYLEWAVRNIDNPIVLGLFKEEYRRRLSLSFLAEQAALGITPKEKPEVKKTKQPFVVVQPRTPRKNKKKLRKKLV
jgi:hypothetical protein